MNNYPQCLIQELAKYGAKPSGNLEWDRATLAVLRNNAQSDAAFERMRLSTTVTRIENDIKKHKSVYPDLTNEAIYRQQVEIFLYIANNVVLSPQSRPFEIDEHNKDVLRFLLYYFNECPLAEEVFPGRGYKLHKNLLLMGKSGVGKTLMLDTFAVYLRKGNNPRQFVATSSTEVGNYYRIYKHIDHFTYNILSGGKGYQSNAFNICFNDLGVESTRFYGDDMLLVSNDFLHARNEIWANFSEFDRKFAHITTNLTIDDLQSKFKGIDAYGRTVDRFKTYNVIPLGGESRR